MAGLPAEPVSLHEQIDLPEVKPLVTHHRRLAVICPTCRTRVDAPVPQTARGTPFGPHLHAVATYLKTFQALSYERLQAALSDLRERLDEPRADIYLIRSKLRQSLREVVDFMVFGPDGGVTIGVESLAAAYRFENGRNVRREEWPLGQPSGGECL